MDVINDGWQPQARPEESGRAWGWPGTPFCTFSSPSTAR